MFFRTSDSIARAHGSSIELAAVSVVVTHLNRLCEAEARVMTRTWSTDLNSEATRVAFHRGVVTHVPR